MQIHQLGSDNRKKDKKRVGRGGKRGTYSGKGLKGQKARAGSKFQPLIRQIIKRYPKRRGYRFKSVQIKPLVLNVAVLEKKFGENDLISPQTLLDKSLIVKKKGKLPLVKLLAKGNLTKALNVSGCLFSKEAEQKIKAAGGKIK
jgi:large subunit ribosomal protein L15